MLMFETHSTKAQARSATPGKATDLKCPRCQRVLYPDFYNSYHAAPWSAIRGQRRCECGYLMSL